ncbi:MAG: ester cyclase [Dehalococcoidia bacterium]
MITTHIRRRLLRVLFGGAAVSALGLALMLGLSRIGTAGDAVAQSAGSGATCPMTTEDENIAIARTWHEQVINRRNPAALQDILAAEVVHHAAGGYPNTMTAAGVAAMMDDFLVAFPDLRYEFDLFIVQDDMVVERYTATGTQEGPLQDLPPLGRTATWTGVNIFRIECGRIVEVWSEVDALSRNQQLSGAKK